MLLLLNIVTWSMDTQGNSGADPGFSERGVRKFKERGLEYSPRSYRDLYC